MNASNKPKFNKNFSDSIELADIVIRANPFHISTIKKTSDDQCVIKKYGKSVITTTGSLLLESDRGTLIVLIKLSLENNDKAFDVDLRDILKLKGLKNPSDKSSLKALKESIQRLLDTEVRIIPDKRQMKKSKTVCFLKGSLKEDYKGRFSLSDYLKAVDDLKLGFAYIKLSSYFKLNSQIARGLYVYLASQKYFYFKKGYEIRLSKLCAYINYDIKSRYWSQVWQHIELALIQLKNLEILENFTREENRKKTDGGMITAWAAKKKKAKSSEIEYSYPDLLEFIEENFPDQVLNDKYKEKLDRALDELTIAEGIRFDDYDSDEVKKGYLEELSKGGAKYVTPSILDDKKPQWYNFQKKLYDKLSSEYEI